MCSRCILESDIPGIMFDEDGICNYCKIHDMLDEQHPLGKGSEQALDELFSKVRTDGQGKAYDCIIGVSGGIDSTYTLYLAVKAGLRPLAVHFDNGWNTETATHNIEKTTKKLGVDLHTVVADWEEFRDLQIAFLRSSTPDLDIPTDIAIYKVLYEMADKENVKYIINGVSFRTEGKIPLVWGYGDGRYIKSVHKRFGKRPLLTFPNFTLFDWFYYGLIKRIKHIRPLYFVEYDKDKVKKLMMDELDWEPYGGKHHESTYTKFIQSHILPKKFKIDKRRVHLSALVRSCQMTKDQAIEELTVPPITDSVAKEEQDYVIKKLGLKPEEFKEIMAKKPKNFLDYPTNYPLLKALKKPLKIAYSLISPSTPQFFYTPDP